MSKASERAARMVNGANVLRRAQPNDPVIEEIAKGIEVEADDVRRGGKGL